MIPNQSRSSAPDKEGVTGSNDKLGIVTNKPLTPPPSVSQAFNLFEFFYNLVGRGGIIEIFGDTGTMKTMLSVLTCLDAKKIKKTFVYIDTEGKVGLINKKNLGEDYKYIPVWNEIGSFCGVAPKKDLLVLDSLGFPIATIAAGMKLDEVGKRMNEMMYLVGNMLKMWAYENNAIVIITNQPKSDFMKSDEEKERLSAYGDKVHFAPNIILKTEKHILSGEFDSIKKKVIPPRTHTIFRSFRSPDFQDDAEIIHLIKSENEIQCYLSSYVEKFNEKLNSVKD